MSDKNNKNNTKIKNNNNEHNIIIKKYLAEGIGTAVLLLFGCGNFCLFSSGTGIETACGFGISFIVCYLFINKISGCHLNPAVSLAYLIRKKLNGKDFAFYCLSQMIGAVAGIAVLCLINIIGGGLFDVSNNFLGANTFGSISKSHITLAGCAVVEFVITLVLVLTILAVMSNSKIEKIAPIIIGLTIILVYLFALPLTGASANPARSFGPAFMMMFYGNFIPILQFIVFALATMAGGAVAGYL